MTWKEKKKNNLKERLLNTLYEYKVLNLIFFIILFFSLYKMLIVEKLSTRLFVGGCLTLNHLRMYI